MLTFAVESGLGLFLSRMLADTVVVISEEVQGKITHVLLSKEVHAKSVQVERQGRLRVLNTNHGVVELEAGSLSCARHTGWCCGIEIGTLNGKRKTSALESI
jgi:hypothetical protein